MKKEKWILLIGLLLAACGPTNDTGTTPPPLPTEPAAPTIAATGLLIGHVEIGPLVPVVREGETEPTPSPAVYAAWVVVVRDADDAREIARADIASDGSYRIELPPGDYWVTGQQREGRALIQQQRYLVTIQAGATTVQNLSLDTGIR